MQESIQQLVDGNIIMQAQPNILGNLPQTFTPLRGTLLLNAGGNGWPNQVVNDDSERGRNRDKSRSRENIQNMGRMRRMKLPMFAGPNPVGWILRAERYFTHYNLSEEDKMESAVLSLEGDALFWFHWADQEEPITSW